MAGVVGGRTGRTMTNNHPSIITKVAQDSGAHRRQAFAYPSARAAMRGFLDSVDMPAGQGVLLPAYVGWSPKEGSGVLDPVEEYGCPYDFYRMSDRLTVDVDHFRAKLASRRFAVVVLVHYFGRPDPALGALVRAAKAAGAIVVEDEAHAMLTDLVGGRCGRLGDASIFSLHKLLPLQGGGTLVVNSRGPVDIGGEHETRLVDFDLATIAQRRRENLRRWSTMLLPLAGAIDPLWSTWGPGNVPQTLPVLVRNVSRDKLYEDLNATGVGVVSLYHTLVSAIGDEFPASHQLERHILNLPVHQDVGPKAIDEAARLLAAAVGVSLR